MDEREKEQRIKRFIGIQKEYSDANYIHEQMDLNKEIIERSYDEEFNNIFSDYTFMMTEIINGLNYERQMIESNVKKEFDYKIRKIYQEKPEKLKFDTKELDKYNIFLSNELEKLYNTIESIKQNIFDKIKSFMPSTPSHYIDTRLHAEGEWYKSQLNQIENDLSSKIDQLDRNWFNTQRKLEEEHENTMLKLQKDNYSSFSEIISEFELIRSQLYAKFYDFQAMHDEYKEQTQKLMQEYKNKQSEWKSRFLQLQNFLLDAENQEKQRVKNRQREIEENEESMKHDEKIFMQAYDVKNETNKVMLDRLRDKIKLEIEELDMKFRNSIPQDNTMEIQKSINELQEKLKNLEEEEKNRIEEEKKNKLYMIELMKEKCTKFQESFDQSDDNIMKEFSNLRLSNQNEINQLKNQHENLFNLTAKNYEEERKLYRENLDIYLALIDKRDQSKMKMKPEKDNYIEKYLQNLTDEEKNLINLLDDEYKLHSIECSKKINDVKKAHQEELKNTEEKFEKINKSTLENQNNLYQAEILLEKQKYQQTYNDLQTELRSIQIAPMTVSANEDNINLIQKQIEDFNQEKISEKDKLTEDWEKLIFDEAMRSKLCLESLKSETLLLETSFMRAKLANSKNVELLDEKIQDLETKLQNLQISGIDNQLEAFNSDDELSKAKAQNEELIKKALQNKEKSVENLEKEISKINYENERKSEDILLAQTSELNSYMLSVQKIQAEHRNNMENMKKEMDKYKIDDKRDPQETSLREQILQKKQNIISLTQSSVVIKDVNQRLMEIEKRYQDELNIMKSQYETRRHLLSCENDMAEKDLRAARLKFENRESRMEDISYIDRLNDILTQKTQNLMMIMKDHQEMRNKIIMQENEYNARFGTLPSVPAAKSPRIRTSLTNSSLKILPKL